MTVRKKQTRPYKRITSQTVVDFKAMELLHGNGAGAIRELEPTRLSERSRAFRIRAKGNDVAPLEFIDTQLQQIGVDAVNRLGMLVNSSDEKVAGVNTRYVIDQLKGKAIQKSVSLTGKVNIQSVLD